MHARKQDLFEYKEIKRFDRKKETETKSQRKIGKKIEVKLIKIRRKLNKTTSINVKCEKINQKHAKLNNVKILQPISKPTNEAKKHVKFG